MKKRIAYKGNLDDLYNETIRTKDHHRDKEFAITYKSEIPFIMDTTSSEGEW